MKTVKPFVDLGFFIVPLNGVIVRLSDGKKKIPEFDGRWKSLYLDTPYNPKEFKKPYAVTGAFITGERSLAVSIDCDNEATYRTFKALDPDYNFEFVSLGKSKKGGESSIIYRLDDRFKDIPAFSIKKVAGIEIDYLTDDKLQFLPTSGNKSKVEWKAETLKTLPELREPPEAVINHLRVLYELYRKGKDFNTSTGTVTQGAYDKHYKNLAPFCEQFIKTQKFDNELFRILTPKDGGFRELPQYQKEKTLHPDNVPDGKGNEYITKVASVLVCDDSISPDLCERMIYAINNMWSSPYKPAIIKEVARFQISRNEWVYDKSWQERISMVLTEYGTMVKLFYDPIIRKYYALDSQMGMSMFTALDLLPKHLNSIVKGNRIYKPIDIYSYLENKRTIMSALEPFGDLPPENKTTNLKRYNMFSRSKQYDVLLNHNKYTEEYEGKTPEITLAFFEHLIPDEETRDYVIRFILTKLTTLKFSEVILYFLGVQGAGKNLLVDWLGAFTANAEEKMQLSDHQLVVEVDLENFLSKYNLWIVNALFANLDEFGEKTTSAIQDRQVLANLKSYTGKAQIQLRTMNSDPISASHKCTFILTANINRLAPDLGDRRLVLIDCPNTFNMATFVMQHGGKSAAIKSLFEEQALFAYYLATEIKPLSMDEYRTPPNTEFKQAMIMKHLPPSTKIATLIKKQKVDLLVDLCDEHSLLQPLIEGARCGAITKNLLKELFLCMTAGSNARPAMLDKSFRDANMEIDRVRINNKQYYGFNFPKLLVWADKHTVTDGEVIIKDEL